jgi:hypothetical protein
LSATATVVPQPLRRLITPIGFGDKSLKIKPTVCGQAFFEKGFDQTFEKRFEVDYACFMIQNEI